VAYSVRTSGKGFCPAPGAVAPLRLRRACLAYLGAAPTGWDIHPRHPLRTGSTVRGALPVFKVPELTSPA